MPDGDLLVRIQPCGKPGGVAVGQRGAEQHHHITRLDESPHGFVHQPAGVHADIAGVVLPKH